MAGAAVGALPGAEAQTAICATYNQEFKMYFESGKAVPTEQGIAVLEQALKNTAYASDCEISQIVIIGHQDTAGLPEFNEALSYAMAFAVAEEFMDRGVPVEKLAGEGKGETELARNSLDDVAEPLNRRGEVSIMLAPK